MEKRQKCRLKNDNMSIKTNYKHTVVAGVTGYFTQAIINNFVPLLFLTFQSSFKISITQMALLVTVNFCVQLLTDLAAVKIVDKLGYRACIVAAHVLAAVGLVGLSTFPFIFSSPYAGLILSVVVYAIGGGMIEVLVSPIIEACPTKNKEGMMSLLHSFYCWGVVAVVIISTVFFALFGISNWRILSICFATIPLLNAAYFCFVPIFPLMEEGEKSLSLKQLFSKKVFWLLLVMMLCAGASEHAVVQWASAFAEAGLKVSKTVGDLLGPCLFAVLMGISRLFYSRFSEKINLQKFIAGSSVLCVLSYLVIVFSPVPIISLLACGVCGLSVGIMWPGTFSIAAKGCKNGGTAMFALLALAGDAGCSLAPTIVGVVSDAAGGVLKWGILAASVFPILLLMGLFLFRRLQRKDELL